MMALNNSTQEVVYLLLEKLKANGTFDEFRRFCVSDIDAKSAYQNWKQRIETSALKFLSKVEYTPELSKNIVWEKMRKHLLDGHETQDISDGADRVLNQLLAPRTLDAFEPKILKVVNEYLGNENGTAPAEINGQNKSTTSSINIFENKIDASFIPQRNLVSDTENVGNIEKTSTEFEPLNNLDSERREEYIVFTMMYCFSVVMFLGLNESTASIINTSENQIITSFNPQTDLISNTENVDNIEETSPEFEPLTSVLDNDNSNDESISGMSDLVSVGSPVLTVSKEINDTNSIGTDNSNTNPIENPQQTHFDKNGITNYKIHNITNNESCSTNSISNNSEKLKTNNLKSKSKHHSSETSGDTNSEDKSSSNRSKNRNSNSHRSKSKENNDIKKRSSSNSKDRKYSSHTKHRSNSKDKEKKNKHKKSRHTERDKTPKRERKDSRSDKKEKNSSLCKEPKSLNGNRSDDESNAGGSSKQKSSINKNRSSTSEKSKSSSNNHKSNQKDSGSKEVVNKSKEKSSILSRSHSSSQINNETNKKRHKRALEEESNKPYIGEKKIKVTSNQELSMTYDEEDAAKALLSLNNIDAAENDTEMEKNTNQILSSTIDKRNKNICSVKNNLKLLQPYDSNDNVSKMNASNVNFMFNEVCAIDIEKTSCQVERLETTSNECVEIYSKGLTHNKLLVNKKEVKTNNAEKNLNFGDNRVISDSNTTLTVPKPKILLNQNNAIKRKIYSKKNETKVNKLSVSSSEVSYPVVDNTSKIVLHQQNKKQLNCDADNKINNTSITSSYTSPKSHENINTQKLNYEPSFNGFKGFSSTNGFNRENYERILNIIESLKAEIFQQNIIDSFKGFNKNTSIPCKHRNIVYAQFIKMTKQTKCFRGFTKNEIRKCDGYESVKYQLEQKIIEKQQNTIIHEENGIPSEKTLNKVMVMMYKSTNDNETTQNDNYHRPDGGINGPVVNNNNHDITASNHWVVEQEMKYKLLPVKVKLERLMEYGCTNTKHISSKVSSTPQKNK